MLAVKKNKQAHDTAARLQAIEAQLAALMEIIKRLAEVCEIPLEEAGDDES